MRLPLAYFGNPVLRKKGLPIEEITDEIRQLVHDMIETMEVENGAGIAAPQVHKSLDLFVTQVPLHDEETDTWEPGELRVFINPKLSKPSEKKWVYPEGCLSIPGVRGEIERPWAITVEATDIEGNQFTLDLEGLEARVVMHENDHIKGTLFPDRMSAKERKKIESGLARLKRKHSSS